MPNYFQLQVSGFVTFSVSYCFKSHIFEFLCWKFTFHWHLINSTIIQLRRKYLQAKKREQNPLLVAAIISSKYLCLFSSTLKPSKYFEFTVHTAVLSIYEWLSAAKETTLLWCYKCILHWAHAHTAFQGTWQVECFMNPAEFQFSGWKELFEIFVSTWVELQQFVCLIFLTKVW